MTLDSTLCLAQASLMSGREASLPISALSFCTIGAGVPAGAHEAEPRHGFIARHAAFGEGRHVRQRDRERVLPVVASAFTWPAAMLGRRWAPPDQHTIQ